MRNRTLIACLLSLLAGCDGTTGPTPLTSASFTVFGGCGDIRLFARNEDDTAAMLVLLPAGLIDQARDQGGETAFAFALPASGLPSVQLQVGHRVSALECTDVVEGGPAIDRTWTPTGGAVAGRSPARGTARRLPPRPE